MKFKLLQKFKDKSQDLELKKILQLDLYQNIKVKFSIHLLILILINKQKLYLLVIKLVIEIILFMVLDYRLLNFKNLLLHHK